MSVLFKSPSSSGGSIGGSSKGFPPGDVINILCRSGNEKIQIKWQEPNDTIIDGITIAKWKGTILVRNNDHYPTSIKDGDIVIDNNIKNKYKDNYFEDTNLTNDHVYYYRFFTYSDEKVYNDSGNLIFKNKPVSFDPILKNNSWEQIVNVVESNSIPDTWNIGDEIDLKLNGYYFNETVTLQIWDFNHFDKSDGTGKAGICFGMKNLMKNKQMMNNTSNNKGGWNESRMKNEVLINVFNCIPLELSSYIKEINTYANREGGTYSEQGLLSKDKVFLPGYTECCSEWSHQTQTETGQKKFPVFTDEYSRIKKMNNGSGITEWWWTRSPRCNYSDSFCCISNYGRSSGTGASINGGVCFCFNI